MINVAFVHHSLGSGGGSERVIFDVIRGLDRSRFRPVLICMYGLGEWGERLRSMGYSTHADVMSGPQDIRGAWRIAGVLENEGVDVLYVSDGLMNMVYARIAAAIAKTPVTALAFHSFDTILRRRASPVKRAALGLVDRVCHPRFSFFIALANSHEKYLIECKGLPAEKIVVVNNGIHVNEYSSDSSAVEKRREFGIPTDARVAVMVAGLRRWKAHDLLLRAADQILGEIPKAHFVLAGDGDERSALEQLARELGIAEHVSFLGKVTDVAGLLKASDVAVLCSEHEAFPLSLLEAMAAMRPVVATDTGSVAEMVIDGVTGFIVQVGAVDELAAAIARILQDPDRGREMGEAGRRLVDDRFTVERSVAAYETLFEQWASCPPTSS